MKDKKKVDTAATETEVEEETEETEEADAEFEASLEGLSEEEQEQKRAERDGSDIDTEADEKAQLAKEKKLAEERAAKAEKALADKRFRESERRRKQDDGGESEEGEDKPLTAAELDARLAEHTEKALKSSQSERVAEIAADIAESTTQAELIIAIHGNRTWPSDIPLREQLEDAKAIATRQRTASKQKELARALAAKGSASRDVGGAHRNGTEGTAPKLAPDVTKSLKAAGFLFDPKLKVYKKKLPSGKFLFKNLTTKRTWVA